MRTLAWIGPRVAEKSLTEQKNKQTYSKTNTSLFALTSEALRSNERMAGKNLGSNRSNLYIFEKVFWADFKS